MVSLNLGFKVVVSITLGAEVVVSITLGVKVVVSITVGIKVVVSIQMVDAIKRKIGISPTTKPEKDILQLSKNFTLLISFLRYHQSRI